jgi:hypothetical protein
VILQLIDFQFIAGVQKRRRYKSLQKKCKRAQKGAVAQKSADFDNAGGLMPRLSSRQE